ncbi:MAG: hypothetical protein V1777_04345 [Candidatus Micrarchaeota archaeon]
MTGEKRVEVGKAYVAKPFVDVREAIGDSHNAAPQVASRQGIELKNFNGQGLLRSRQAIAENQKTIETPPANLEKKQ